MLYMKQNGKMICSYQIHPLNDRDKYNAIHRLLLLSYQLKQPNQHLNLLCKRKFLDLEVRMYQLLYQMQLPLN